MPQIHFFVTVSLNSPLFLGPQFPVAKSHSPGIVLVSPAVAFGCSELRVQPLPPADRPDTEQIPGLVPIKNVSAELGDMAGGARENGQDNTHVQ